MLQFHKSENLSQLENSSKYYITRNFSYNKIFTNSQALISTEVQFLLKGFVQVKNLHQEFLWHKTQQLN